MPLQSRRRVASLALGVLSFVLHAELGLADNQQGFLCSLDPADVALFLEPASRTWNVTDAVLTDHDLQDIINCTREGDSISLQTRNTIRPGSRVVVPRQLTIDGDLGKGSNDSDNNQKAFLTCPPGSGLFLIRNLIIKGCRLFKKQKVDAIIEMESCPTMPPSPCTVQFYNVDFLRNKNGGGSVGLVVHSPECYRVSMQNVSFQQNKYAASSQFSFLNTLKNVSVLSNDIYPKPPNVGAVFHFPEKSMTTISQLLATKNYGAVLDTEGSRIKIKDSKFLKSLSWGSGVIEASSSDVFVSGSLFEANTCLFCTSAVFFEKCNATFLSNRFVDGIARYGGALFLRDPQTVKVVSSAFESNQGDMQSLFFPSEGGGAVYIENSRSFASTTSVRISDCLFRNNSATRGGSGVYVKGLNKGSVKIDSSIFLDNKRVASVFQSAEKGGAILIKNSKNIVIEVRNSSFESNNGVHGVAIGFLTLTGSIRLESTVFTKNGKDEDGSSVLLKNPVTSNVKTLLKVNLNNLTFKDNGLLNNLTFKDKGFRQRKVFSEAGSALHVDGNNIRMHVIKSSFLKNQGIKGGAICMRAGDLYVRQCKFEWNCASRGGAIWLSNSVIAGIKNSKFRENKALYGGAVSSQKADVIFKDLRFLKNRADVGGALHFAGAWKSYIESCSFKMNNVSVYGGAVFLHMMKGDDHFVLGASSFTRNSAKLGGGVFIRNNIHEVIRWTRPTWIRPLYLYLHGTSFRHNHAQLAGGAVFVDKLSNTMIGCGRYRGDSDLARHGLKSDNYVCESMTNSVGDGGYGPCLATFAEHFVVHVLPQEGTNETVHFVEPGETYSIPDWKTCNTAYMFKVVMMDYFLQANAVSSDTGVCNKDVGQAIFGKYVKATIESPDGLISNALIADVSSGHGRFVVESPYRQPGNYSLVLWIGENKAANVTINVTIRGQGVDEETTTNGTLSIDKIATS